MDRFYTAMGCWTEGRRTETGRTPDAHTGRARFRKCVFSKPLRQQETETKNIKRKTLTLLQWSQKKSIPAALTVAKFTQKKAYFLTGGSVFFG